MTHASRVARLKRDYLEHQSLEEKDEEGQAHHRRGLWSGRRLLRCDVSRDHVNRSEHAGVDGAFTRLLRLFQGFLYFPCGLLSLLKLKLFCLLMLFALFV